jgi:hypothetical protein
VTADSDDGPATAALEYGKRIGDAIRDDEPVGRDRLSIAATAGIERMIHGIS